VTASESATTGLGVHPLRLRNGAIAALRLLEICPLVPVDAFVHLVGLTSRTSAYQQLARLKRAGLAEMRRAHLGYLIGERRVGLWKITHEGRQALRAAGVHLVAPEASATGHPLQRGVIRRAPRIRDGDLPRLVAAYRVLSWLVAERAAAGRPVDVRSWESPWIREVWCAQQKEALRVTLPAGAALVPRAAHGMIEEAIARMPRSCSSCLRYSANTSKRRMRFAGLIVTRAKVHFAGAFAGRVQA